LQGLNIQTFYGFWQAKFVSGGLLSGLKQFLLLPQLPLKITLNLKVVKLTQKLSFQVVIINP
jgi:hypothetical protein